MAAMDACLARPAAMAGAVCLVCLSLGGLTLLCFPPTLSLDLDSFVVSGTLISRRQRTEQEIYAKLTRRPHWWPSPSPSHLPPSYSSLPHSPPSPNLPSASPLQPALPLTPAQPVMDHLSLSMLISAPHDGANVLLHTEALQQLTRSLEEVSDDVVSPIALPARLAAQGATSGLASLLQTKLARTADEITISLGLAYFLGSCAATGSPPCGVREHLGCAPHQPNPDPNATPNPSEDCTAPCQLPLNGRHIDACSLAREIRPTSAELSAVLAAASNDSHPSPSALCALTAWAARSPSLIEAVPLTQRLLAMVDQRATERLAAASDATRVCRVTTLRLAARVPYRWRDEQAKRQAGFKVEHAAQELSRVCAQAGLRCSWFERVAFKEEAIATVASDGRLSAVGTAGIEALVELTWCSVALYRLEGGA